jgi:transcriptional regulator with XRE-family HTH domain
MVIGRTLFKDLRTVIISNRVFHSRSDSEAKGDPSGSAIQWRHAMTNLSAEIGERLRRLRAERHLSLAKVAEKAGVSVATLSRVETNKQNMDVSMLITLAGILGVPASEILDDSTSDDDRAALTRRLARLSRADRTKLFVDSSRRREKALSSVVDDLLATLDILRDELIEVQQTARQKKR